MTEAPRRGGIGKPRANRETPSTAERAPKKTPAKKPAERKSEAKEPETRRRGGSIDQLGSGRWRARVTLPGGKRISLNPLGFDTEKQAEDAIKRWHAHNTLGLYIDPTRSATPIADVWREMLGTLGGKQGTKKDRERFENRCITGIAETSKAGNALGPVPVGSMTLPQAQLWAMTLHNQGVAYSTINKWWGFLNRIMEYAVDSQMIRENPLRGKNHNIPSGGSKSKPHYIFTFEEVIEFTWAASPDHALMWEILFWTGIRQGELRALIGRSLLPNGDLRIDGNITEADPTKPEQMRLADSKGLFRDTTKTGAGDRDIAIPKPLYKRLKDRAVEVGNPMLPLFPDPQGEWLPSRTINQNFTRITKRPGLTGDPHDPMPGRRRTPTPHDARATFASWMAAAGISKKDAQNHLGHADAATTENVYQSSVRWLSADPAIAKARAEGMDIETLVKHLYKKVWKRAEAMADVYDADPATPLNRGGRRTHKTQPEKWWTGDRRPHRRRPVESA